MKMQSFFEKSDFHFSKKSFYSFWKKFHSKEEVKRIKIKIVILFQEVKYFYSYLKMAIFFRKIDYSSEIVIVDLEKVR